MNERLLCPNCGSRRLMRIYFGYISFPWSFKNDSQGRDRVKRDDVRHTMDRTRNGGCCVDLDDTFECARCHCHITLGMDITPDDKIVRKLSIQWSPEEGYEP